MARALTGLSLLGAAWAQQAGTQQEEVHPAVSVTKCEPECAEELLMLTLDSQRRWLHNAELTNCFEGEDWDGHICPDGQTCATSCELEGIDVDAYSTTYGVTAAESEVEIKFIVETEFGQNVGSRLYLMEGEDTYKMFSLKNREIAFEVDVNSLPCGLNAALYLVEMPADGGKSSGNTAGAKFGTGYCDAQCPHDLKFIDGEANIKGWKGAIGGAYGACCAEMDLFEANKMGGAFTAHPCGIQGAKRCEGADCGDADSGHYYQGVCDHDGCDVNPYRLGNKDFYGPGLKVDPQKPFTVVTQFLTVDGTDDGDLAEIRQHFVQDGQVIKHPGAQGIDGVEGNSITNAFCAASKEAFHQCRVKNNPNGAADQFNKHGGLKSMGAALDRGMVLVLSLWDDPTSGMRWLDSASPGDLDETVPGVVRGPCPRQAGKAVRTEAGDAFVKYSNIKYGHIGATTEGVQSEELSPLATAPLPVTPHASAEVSTDGMTGVVKNVTAAFDTTAANADPTTGATTVVDKTATVGATTGVQATAGAGTVVDSAAGVGATTGVVATPGAAVGTAAATAASGDMYDCTEGVATWLRDWPAEKKNWCCTTKHFPPGCTAAPAARLSDASLPALARAPGAGLLAASLAAAAAAAAGATAWRRARQRRAGGSGAEIPLTEMEEEPLVA
ncbi:unnamed protein product [Prorocentrum cordatum]|uniref:cellulase n=1 Tax=Prorocentrum cordatum TaxID=2364126 RepID=A0ABN9U350_9DINO|nr:unnamed protein product [Polarella glacialis]